jgi:WD40 repeat protein
LMLNLKRNLPDDYDLNLLSLDLIRQLLDTKDNRIMTFDDGDVVKFWDAVTGRLLKMHQLQFLPNTFALSNDGYRIALSNNHSIQIWNSHLDILLLTMHSDKEIDGILFTSNDTGLIIIGETFVDIRDSTSGSQISYQEYPNLDWTYPSNIFTIDENDSAMYIRNALSDEIIFKCDEPETYSQYQFEMSIDQTVVVFYNDDVIIPFKDNNRMKIIYSHNVSMIAISPDNRFIVSGYTDGKIKGWDVERGYRVFTERYHTDDIICIYFCLDSSKFISISQEKTLIWDVSTWNPIAALKTPDMNYCKNIWGAEFYCHKQHDNKLVDYLRNH